MHSRAGRRRVWIYQRSVFKHTPMVKEYVNVEEREWPQNVKDLPACEDVLDKAE